MQTGLSTVKYAREHLARVVGVTYLVMEAYPPGCSWVEVVCALSELAAHHILEQTWFTIPLSQVDRELGITGCYQDVQMLLLKSFQASHFEQVLLTYEANGRATTSSKGGWKEAVVHLFRTMLRERRKQKS